MRKPNGQNLTYAIVEQLGHAVVTGAYSDTDPFPIEAQLCEQFDASRTVLREAVKMLTAKGLLTARPRQGTYQLEDMINTALRFSIRLTNQTKGVALADVNVHCKAFDAIEARNPQRARAAMETIIREVMELITAARKNSKTGTAALKPARALKPA